MSVSVRAALVVALLLALATWAAPSAAQPKAPEPTAGATKPQAESCATCHLETGDERLEKPAKAYPQDIHHAKGLGCIACHGGDGKAEGMEAMDPAKGYIGKPERDLRELSPAALDRLVTILGLPEQLNGADHPVR